MDSKTLNMKSSTLKMFLLKGENLRLKDKLTEKENKITQLKIDQTVVHHSEFHALETVKHTSCLFYLKSVTVY